MMDSISEGSDGMASDPESRQAWENVLDDPDQPLYSVGLVADLFGVDPQVVRGYDRPGLVEPDRSDGGHRRYSRSDVHRLSRAMRLSAEGIPASGIVRILSLEDELANKPAGGQGLAQDS